MYFIDRPESAGACLVKGTRALCSDSEYQDHLRDSYTWINVDPCF